MKLFFVCVSAAVLFSACGKAEDPSSSSSDGGKKSAATAAAEHPRDDMSKPYLSEAKVGNFIKSLEGDRNAFEILTTDNSLLSAAKSGKRLAELDALAKKYGFENTEDYMAVWSRLMAANLALMAEATMKTTREMYEGTIKISEEQLKRTDLTPELREMNQEQIKASREALEEFKKPQEKGLNDKDIEIFRKHKAAFEEAMTKVGNRKK